MVLPLNDHPLREALVLELHARPYEPLAAPERVSHLAVLAGAHGIADDRAHLARLCARYGVPPPPEGANHFAADFGPFRVRWEGHTEFSAYTFIRRASFAHPFEEPVIDLVPADWLAGLPGQVLAAVHLAVEPRDASARDSEALARLFGGNTVVGARVAGGAGLVWSDLRLHADRFARILVRDVAMNERQAGRLAQRLLEVHAYRMMALLALPVARELGPRLQRLDRGLAEVAARMSGSAGGRGDAELLAELSRLAAGIEAEVTATSYRFAAARAYYDLVRRRLAELREQRIEGVQTFSEFLDRRLAPAMATCQSTAARQEALSERAARVASLLRARVEVELERQNQEALAAMSRRARIQLRLQETVEGLSVVAISYYLVGLVGYGFKAAKTAGARLDPDITTGLAVPVVVALVWFGLRRARRALFGRRDD